MGCPARNGPIDIPAETVKAVAVLNSGVDPEVVARAQADIRRRAEWSGRSDGVGIDAVTKLRNELIRLAPNLAAPADVFNAPSASESDIAATKQLLTKGDFDIESADAPLRLFGAIAEQIGLDFVVSGETTAEMTAASCARTADFAMGNDLVTENSLYLLGSGCPSHIAKGVSLDFDFDIDIFDRSAEEIREKLNRIHNVKSPDSVILVGVTPTPTSVTYSLPANARRDVGSKDFKSEFGSSYVGHEYIGAFRELRIDRNKFAPEWNRDFRIAANIVHEKRGGLTYDSPAGFMRYGLKVSGHFDGGNDTWLGMSNSPGEWAVAYHGTKHPFVKSIIESPLKAGSGQACGYGIYCSPDIETASGYASPITIDGQNYQYVFMCRVNVSSVHHCTTSPCPEARNPTFTLHMTLTSGYWFVNAENQNYQNIRTYGLLVRASNDGKSRRDPVKDNSPRQSIVQGIAKGGISLLRDCDEDSDS
jgi:hypothetical protein